MTAVSTKSFDESMADFAIGHTREQYETERLTPEDFLREEAWRRFGVNMNAIDFPSDFIVKDKTLFLVRSELQSYSGIDRVYEPGVVDTFGTYSTIRIPLNIGTNGFRFEIFLNDAPVGAYNESFMTDQYKDRFEIINSTDPMNPEVVKDNLNLYLVIIKSLLNSNLQCISNKDKVEEDNTVPMNDEQKFQLVKRLLDLIDAENIQVDKEVKDLTDEIVKEFELDRRYLEIGTSSYKKGYDYKTRFTMQSFIISEFGRYTFYLTDRRIAKMCYSRLTKQFNGKNEMTDFEMKLVGLITLLPELLKAGWTRGKIFEFINNDFSLRKEK